MAKNTFFQFKQFRIEQKNCGMKVTSDASIFGASINYRNGRSILDIGTGTGLLALMSAQKTDAMIDAVELDEGAAKQAQENVYNSPWKNRIHVHQMSIQAYSETCDKKYDNIICNPPFYTQSTMSKEATKRSAWHDEHLPYDDLIVSVMRLIEMEGRFHILLPAEESRKFSELCIKKETLFPCYQLHIKPFSHSKNSRIITGYQKKEGSCTTSELVVYKEPQQLSDAAHQLLKEFYLYL